MAISFTLDRPARTRLRPAVLALCLLAPSSASIAQASPQPAAPLAGTRVQFRLGDGTLRRGSLLGRRGDDILVLAKSDTTVLHDADVLHAFQFAGRHERGVRAIVAGAGIGAAIGGMLVLIAATTPSHHTDLGSAMPVALGATGVFALVGAMVGSMVAVIPEDEWTEFDPVTIPAIAVRGAGR